ncbi:MAG: hypothetical protein HQL49_01155 [Gammaproteobacteria bacterium]|nr:hypothetical protein [Gammaproteobacteria bacterium]
MISANESHKAPESATPAVNMIPPGYFVPYQGQTGQGDDDDEISLLELWSVVWAGKWHIIGLSLLFAAVAAVVSLQMPNYYKAEVLLAPVSAEKGGGGLSAALGGLGGLASLAGVSLGGGGGDVKENLAVLNSRKFLVQFIESEKLMPLLFADKWSAAEQKWVDSDPEKQPTQWDAFRTMSGVLQVSEDKKSGLVRLSVEWTDAALATSWANLLVERLNAHLRQEAIERSQDNLKYLNQELAGIEIADMRQTLFALISKEQKQAMLANTQQEFAFRVLDAAVEPDKKSKPKRSLIVVLATLVGGMLGLFWVFVSNALKNHRERQAAEAN